MKYLIYICAVLTVLIACSKDKFETTPNLRLISISPQVVPPNTGVVIRLKWTDKEGDLDTILIMKKQRNNIRTVPASNLNPELYKYDIPAFPKTSEGEFELHIPNNDLVAATNPLSIPGTNPPQKEADSLTLKFAIKDKAGHNSDTVSIPNVVILRN